MNEITLNKQSAFLLKLLAAVVMMAVLALAGRSDYNDEVCDEMGADTYRAISRQLGTTDESSIVDAYMSDRDYWRAQP